MGKVDLEKLRSIGHVGRHADDSRLRRTVAEDGSTTGYQIDHPDGRLEAVVTPAHIRAQVSISDPSTVRATTVTPAPVAAGATIPQAGT